MIWYLAALVTLAIFCFLCFLVGRRIGRLDVLELIDRYGEGGGKLIDRYGEEIDREEQP